ncbi:2-C-methyl-D-erythritol 4-phosphate cytidylyltransferase [Desulfurobacterium atlanticum]|uniref:2-C-methyl-D-erythritol 4-phosphate cytidylyltransferase n=1 Tax=Desulfurobacterium atlanticum TaxID=240169 RepID=A0A238Y3S6_9BACT|nr:2-C-methyl-D-erythritol 4-phosphate cytidylyltransferase [Desulfurobacterium atlanticum]SNR65313.1 2-C-methyl-D-erythritol 4-phosphate cytidylyltransferase [Desulfurobacterium atlanticum]
MRYAIIPAAGKGKRFGKKKQFVKVNGKTIIQFTVEVFEKSEFIDRVVVVAPEDAIKEMEKELEHFSKVEAVVKGGCERQSSVLNGLKAIEGKCKEVIVHDGVRPLVTKKLISELFGAYQDYGVEGVITAVKPKDTIKVVGANLEGNDSLVIKTLNRERLILVQTPQLFNYEVLYRCHKKAFEEGFWGTDDASLLEHYGHTVVAIKGDYRNIKITTPEDMEIFKIFLSQIKRFD